jgi:hypothetical protein
MVGPFMYSQVLLSRRSLLAASSLALVLPSRTFAAISATPSRPLWLSPQAQRCAKAYSQSALNVMPEQSKAVMLDAQRSMAASMLQLRGVTHYELQREVLRFDTLLTAAPARKILLAVSHQSNVVQDTMAREQPLSQHGELAMLSQRLAKNFFLIASGIEQPALKNALLDDQRAFTKTLSEALRATSNSTATQRTLQLADAQWVFYDLALKAPLLPTSQERIAATSERLWSLLSPMAA